MLQLWPDLALVCRLFPFAKPAPVSLRLFPTLFVGAACKFNKRKLPPPPPALSRDRQCPLPGATTSQRPSCRLMLPKAAESSLASGLGGQRNHRGRPVSREIDFGLAQAVGLLGTAPPRSRFSFCETKACDNLRLATGRPDCFWWLLINGMR